MLNIMLIASCFLQIFRLIWAIQISPNSTSQSNPEHYLRSAPASSKYLHKSKAKELTFLHGISGMHRSIISLSSNKHNISTQNIRSPSTILSLLQFAHSDATSIASTHHHSLTFLDTLSPLHRVFQYGLHLFRIKICNSSSTGVT